MISFLCISISIQFFPPSINQKILLRLIGTMGIIRVCSEGHSTGWSVERNWVIMQWTRKWFDTSRDRESHRRRGFVAPTERVVNIAYSWRHSSFPSFKVLRRTGGTCPPHVTVNVPQESISSVCELNDSNVEGRGCAHPQLWLDAWIYAHCQLRVIVMVTVLSTLNCNQIKNKKSNITTNVTTITTIQHCDINYNIVTLITTLWH